jgi:hypothetical protein
LGNYLSRLGFFSEIPPTMEGILVKIMIELLGVLVFATLQIKQGRLSEFVLPMVMVHSLGLAWRYCREICKEAAG